MSFDNCFESHTFCSSCLRYHLAGGVGCPMRFQASFTWDGEIWMWGLSLGPHMRCQASFVNQHICATLTCAFTLFLHMCIFYIMTLFPFLLKRFFKWVHICSSVFLQAHEVTSFVFVHVPKKRPACCFSKCCARG